jgi:hypothetical protein
MGMQQYCGIRGYRWAERFWQIGQTSFEDKKDRICIFVDVTIRSDGKEYKTSA